MSPIIFTHTGINDESIFAAMKKLNVAGSPGRHGMSPLLVNKNMSHLVEPLKFIFRLPLSQAACRQDWKHSVICPVNKNNNNQSSECSSYRPMCFLMVLYLRF